MKIFPLILMPIFGFYAVACEASCGDYGKKLRRDMADATYSLEKWENHADFAALPGVINKISSVKENTEKCIDFFRKNQLGGKGGAEEFYKLSVLLAKMDKIKNTVEKLTQKMQDGKRNVRVEMQLIPLTTKDFWRKYQELYPDSK